LGVPLLNIDSNKKSLITRINELKKEKDAIILVHNYQSPEIYEIADFLGDSLELSQKAMNVESDFIVFCGVDFMAETANILNPQRTTLIPSKAARCPMAAQITGPKLQEYRKKNPDVAVVCYVNTSAEVKALSDICCTSANAVKIVNSLENDKILFVPDRNLALYVQRHTQKEIIPWDGGCYVHMKFTHGKAKMIKENHPKAIFLVHPESPPEVIDLADYVGSTSGMLKYAKESPEKEFIVATEVGLAELMRIRNPEKTFYEALPGAVCIQMKKTTLSSVVDCLEEERYKVEVPGSLRIKAKNAIEKMLQVH
jgi:quinolinate synthase